MAVLEVITSGGFGEQIVAVLEINISGGFGGQIVAVA